MSQQFLSQILKIENETAGLIVASLLQIQSDTSETCCICLQDIGTLVSLFLQMIRSPTVRKQICKNYPGSIILSVLMSYQ